MQILFIIIILCVLWSIWGFFGSRVERADYTVVKKTRSYEIREYGAHIVAQTIVKGAYKESMNAGFIILARYIFGGNAKKERIAMTAPVIAQKTDRVAGERIAMTAPVLVTDEGNSRTVSFGMPRSYTLETLPAPTDSRITIVVIPNKKYAVMRFSWCRSDARIARMQKNLLSALIRDGVTMEGGVAYAGYNAPWTPPWMMRNEVLVEVQHT